MISEYIILKNIKSKGKIQSMNIEQRPVNEEVSKKTMITEIGTIKRDTLTPEKKTNIITPDFNLIKINSPKTYYASEVDLKNVSSLR